MNDNNLVKRLSSGLSVFGWYTTFDEAGVASVHVDLGFNTGKFGARPEDHIQFELDFRRVELVVLCGDGVTPIRSTIARAMELAEGKIHTIQETRAEGEVAASISKSGTSMPEFGFNASGKASRSTQTKIERVTTSSAVIIRHTLTEDRNPTWEVTESTGSALSGSPWDPVVEPRFKFRFLANKIDRQPTIRVLVKCRTEDLIIKSIKIKDAKKEHIWRKHKSADANRIAAEQFLKALITKEGLPLPHLDHDYGDVTVADVVLTVE